MTFIEHLRLLQRMDGLIHLKRTGTAEALAELLGISRRSIFNYFEDLRVLGADIYFCSDRKSYIYVGGSRPQLPTIVL